MVAAALLSLFALTGDAPVHVFSGDGPDAPIDASPGDGPDAPIDASPGDGPDAPIDFAAEVRPLLSDRCFTCHGPGSEEPAAGLRLDDRESAVDEFGFSAIVPGDAAASSLVARLTHDDPERRMPPAESNLSLTADEIALLTRWIEEGADYGEHWSFTRPARSDAPAVRDAAWPRDELDRFVLARLEAAEIAPAPEADPATLLRRVSLDLTGLPPTVDELRAFLGDGSPDRYERAVDRLLASTAHAERLTAHWLDVARYADTFGYQSDVDTNVWPWRDWVIGAFESNLPYDAFVTQQLAGDLLPDATHETRLATAFNRLHRQTNEGGSVEEEFRVEYVCDRVETMAGAFLGLTVGCARCHDHKFDPITQRDYFSLFAFFDGIDESGLYSHFTNAVPTPTLDLPRDEQVDALVDADEAVARTEESAAGPPPLRVLATTDFGDVGEETCVAKLRGGPEVVRGDESVEVRLDGENSIVFPEVGVFERSDPFSISLSMRLPVEYDRAVVIHRTKSWTDSGSRGYQLLVEDGRLLFAIVHFWPGDAIAIRAADVAPVDAWLDVELRYDGSSRADGMAILVDGEPIATEVVRDRLTRTIRGGSIEHLTIGARFRDRGFEDGAVRSITVRGLDGDASPEHEALRAARAERDALRDAVRQIMTMRDEADGPVAQRTAYVLRRGVYSERGEPIGPATPAFLPALAEDAPTSRLDLARWLTHPDHPLTARVHVDRLWRLTFGAGLAPSPEDLGSQSRPPAHLALLDTLSRDLVESGWDSRAMLRRFVLSSTYRQSSAAEGQSLERDPDGALFSRSIASRLDAETIRDSILLASGRLAPRRGGPPVRPYQPPGLWQEKSGKVYRPSGGDDLRRRSLYTFWRRTSPPPTMTMFDAPSREVCRVARPATTTPLQALALWNDPQFVDASVALARRAVETCATDGERIEHLMLALASRPPTANERSALLGLLTAQRATYGEDRVAARALATYDLERVARAGAAAPPAPTEPGDDGDVEVAATAVVASAMLGLDEVVTRR